MTRPGSMKHASDSRIRDLVSARVLLLMSCLWLCSACVDYTVVVTEYDPDRTFNGTTYFTSRDAKRILGVDLDGTIAWDFISTDNIAVGDANGFRYHEGNVVYIFKKKPMMVRVEDKKILFDGPREEAHHSIIRTPHDTLMFLAGDPFEIDYPPWYPVTCVQGDVIKEIDLNTREIVWEWRLRDHVDPIEHHNPDRRLYVGNGCLDWSHGNTVKFFPDYRFDGKSYKTVLYNSAGLDTFWMIDYATGDVLWSCGLHGTLGQPSEDEEPIFAPAHEVDMVENNVFILYDNGSHRQVKASRALKLRVDPVAGEVQEIWSWTYPLMYDWWGGDADELPNGNVLITNVEHGRLIEVTPDGDIVWDMHFLSPIILPFSIYQHQRVPYEGGMRSAFP